jgi:hypothetical protein
MNPQPRERLARLNCGDRNKQVSRSNGDRGDAFRSCAQQEKGILIMNSKVLTRAKLALSAVSVLLLSASVTNAQQSESSKPKYEFPAPQSLSIPLAAEVDLSVMPEMTEVPQSVRFMPPVRMPIGEDAYRRLKEQASGLSSAPPLDLPAAPAQPSELMDTPTAIKSFAGVGEFSAGCGGFIPSDGGFAANGTYLVQVANSCIEIEKALNGTVVSKTALNAFFGFPAAHVVGDPRALFDWNANRFIVIAEDFSVCPTILGVAVSKNSNPVTGGWFVYRVGMGGFGDFPMMGQTLQEFGDAKGAIYLSWNLFGCTTNTSTNVVQIAGKTRAYSGAGLVGSSFSGITFGGVPLDSIQPVSVTGRGDRPRTEYLVSAANAANPLPSFCSGSTCNGYSVLSIAHGIGAGGPVFSGFAVSSFNAANFFHFLNLPTYKIPPNARQRGVPSGACLVDTGDNQIIGQAYYKSSSIYFAHSAKVGTTGIGSGTHFSKFQPVLSTADGIATLANGGVLQNDVCFGCAGQGTNGSNYYGSIVPDPDGNLTMVYEFYDDNSFPSEASLSDRVSFPRGSVHDSGLFLASGLHQYCQLDNQGRNRWGDYTGTAPAVVTTPTLTPFWFWGQFSDAAGNWATRKGRNGYTSVDKVGD